MTWTLNDLESMLRNSPNEWRWYAAMVIDDIPRGYLASYGTIARVANERHDFEHRRTKRRLAATAPL